MSPAERRILRLSWWCCSVVCLCFSSFTLFFRRKVISRLPRPKPVSLTYPDTSSSFAIRSDRLRFMSLCLLRSCNCLSSLALGLDPEFNSINLGPLETFDLVYVSRACFFFKCCSSRICLLCFHFFLSMYAHLLSCCHQKTHHDQKRIHYHYQLPHLQPFFSFLQLLSFLPVFLCPLFIHMRY